MFTFDLWLGSLGTSIFGTQVQSQVILDTDYLPDYLSVPYNYDLKDYYIQTKTVSIHQKKSQAIAKLNTK